MNTRRYGYLNGHASGIVLKELIRRAMVVIANECRIFEVHSKPGYGSSMADVFTSADRKAQEVIVKSLTEAFPEFGRIGEEDGMCHLPPEMMGYFTIDPLDGTKAFVRKQSHGVATMIAMVLASHPLRRPEIVSAYIGDVNTKEIYGYRPDSIKVHRITNHETSEVLPRGRDSGLFEGYALLRDPIETFESEEFVRKTVGRFDNYLIDGSSIGTWFARLWKGEVTALLLPPGHETPWDSTPIIGISEMLGYVFMKPLLDGNGWEGWEQFLPIIPKEVYRRTHDVLVVHEKHLPELYAG